MKKSLLIFASVLVVVIFVAGISVNAAQAQHVPQPSQLCEFTLNYYDSIGALLRGSKWDAVKERCILGIYDKTNGTTNICYPRLDIYQVEWQSSTMWTFNFIGCTGPGGFIKENTRGESNLGNGTSFEHESQTCVNGCQVSKSALTGAANSALGSLDGKVLGKTYIQIRDNNGNLTSGDFKLCFQAKGTSNPYFYRFGGGKSWTPMGGYWNGNQFCMSGSASGNYVLVDMP